MESNNLKFVPSSTFYEDNDGSIFLVTITRIKTDSNHINVKYHWLSNHVGKEFVIHNI